MSEILAERFQRKYRHDPETGCWVWIAGHFDNGYGCFAVNGRATGAHRFSYELHVGQIPIGLQIDHLCRNPGCVNPDHLEAVTAQENTLRGNAPSAVLARRSCCKHGHPLTPDNVYPPSAVASHAGRRCKTCTRKEARERARRKRAQIAA